MSDPAIHGEVLPVGGAGRVSTAWWGMASLIATEGILFIYLVFSFAYLGTQQSGQWPPGGPPSLALALPNTVLLVGSSILLGWGVRRFGKRQDSRQLALALAGTLALGVAFVTIQGFEWAGKPFAFSTNAYSSIFFLLTGLHMAHVAAGLVMLMMLLVWTLMGRFSATRHEHIRLGALYWHFVDVVWIAVLVTVYLTPYLK